MRKLPVLALAAALAAGGVQAQTPLTWRTIANNADLMPGSTLTFSSFNQPSVNSNGMVVFRARSKGSDAGGESVNSTEISARPSTWSTIAPSAAAGGGPVHGIYTRVMAGWLYGTAIVEITARGKTVPQPNNALINGALATFEEYPSTPRIDILSPMIATRGQSQPVYEYQIGIDPATGLPLTTKVGTSGIYTNPGNVLMTGASLLGAVTDFPSGTVTFPYYSVPGATAGTRFDQFPGSPAVANGTIIAFKGNYTDPSDGLGKTGVYYRDVVGSCRQVADPARGQHRDGDSESARRARGDVRLDGAPQRSERLHGLHGARHRSRAHAGRHLPGPAAAVAAVADAGRHRRPGAG